ncbi:MAG: BatA and WFA domain-containing protein [Planctomycetes bacterium]|nr:BatA and WFA domain-containing protein [Planctomycetota bacterium]
MVHLWFLWFLPLTLVPIILHLITLHRLRTVELSTFRFLMDSYIQQRRRVKLLEFLLMLLRTAFVALIILMLARPMTQSFHWLTGQGGREVALVIDAGAAMGLRSGGTTALERARSAAESLLNSLSPDDRVTVVVAADKPRTLLTRPASEKKPILEAIAGITPASGPANMAAALDEVFANRQRATRLACVVTQANQRAWEGLAGHPVTQRIGDDNRLVILDVGSTQPVTNLSMTGDPPRAGRSLVGLPVILKAVIAHTAGETPVNTALSVFLDNQQVSQTGISLQPGQKTTRTITVTPTKPGVIRGRFQLQDDAFAADNVYHFTLNVDPKLKVLVVTPAYPPPPAEPPDLFIRAALASPLEARTGATEERAIAQALDVSSVVYTTLTDAMLDAADVVLLSDVPLDATLGTRLRRFVDNGGGLFVLPGPAVDPVPYQTYLFDVGNTGPFDPRKPHNLAYLPPVGDPDRESLFQPFTAIDLSHPILAAFNEPGVEFFATARVFRWFPINVPTVSNNGEDRPRAAVLMRLPNRTPMLVDMPVGEGRMLVAGFAATPDWSSLPLKPEFVPMMLRSVAYLRRAPGLTSPPSVQPGEPAPIYITSRWSEARAEAIDPAGKSSPVALHRSGTQLVGAALTTEQPGDYLFRVQPNTPGAPDRVEQGWSVNLQVMPSDFAPLKQERLNDLLRPAKVVYLKGSPNDPVFAGELSRRSELWRTLIIAMFVVIGLEFALSTLKPDTRKPEESSGLDSRSRWASLFRLPWQVPVQKETPAGQAKNTWPRSLGSDKR